MPDGDNGDDHSNQPRRAVRYLTLATFLLFAAIGSKHLSAQGGTLCATGEKVWFEADYVGSQRRIAVCGRPSGNDSIGTIRVLQKSGTGNDTGTANIRVMAKASGDRRASVFTIRRYTRFRTTYLKFSFADENEETVIYDSFADGQMATSMSQASLPNKSTPRETQLKQRSESLLLMGLERVVRILPFDE